VKEGGGKKKPERIGKRNPRNPPGKSRIFGANARGVTKRAGDVHKGTSWEERRGEREYY